MRWIQLRRENRITTAHIAPEFTQCNVMHVRQNVTQLVGVFTYLLFQVTEINMWPCLKWRDTTRIWQTNLRPMQVAVHIAKLANTKERYHV